jgi:hypothetical protein
MFNQWSAALKAAAVNCVLQLGRVTVVWTREKQGHSTQPHSKELSQAGTHPVIGLNATKYNTIKRRSNLSSPRIRSKTYKPDETPDGTPMISKQEQQVIFALPPNHTILSHTMGGEPYNGRGNLEPPIPYSSPRCCLQEEYWVPISSPYSLPLRV